MPVADPPQRHAAEWGRATRHPFLAASGAPAYQQFVEHWTAPQVAGYVEALESAAHDAFGDATGGADFDAVVRQVVHAESRFWDVAWAGWAP